MKRPNFNRDLSGDCVISCWIGGIQYSQTWKITSFEGLMISVVFNEKAAELSLKCETFAESCGTFGDVGEKAESMSTG